MNYLFYLKYDEVSKMLILESDTLFLIFLAVSKRNQKVAVKKIYQVSQVIRIVYIFRSLLICKAT